MDHPGINRDTAIEKDEHAVRLPHDLTTPTLMVGGSEGTRTAPWK